MHAYLKDGTNETYSYDHLGSIVGLQDSRGKLKETYRYDELGILDKSTPQSNRLAVNFGYTGYPNEGNGLSFAQARYYNPEIGRFISEDTYEGDINDPRSLNRYTYVLNNPLKYTDKLGLWNEALTLNWMINEQKLGWLNDPSKRSQYNKEADRIRDAMRKQGVAEKDIMQRSDAAISEGGILQRADKEVPLFSGALGFTEDFWNYPGEAAVVSGMTFLGFVNNSKKLSSVATLAKNYKLTDKQFKVHILAYHGFNSIEKFKGKFNKVFDIKAGIHTALTRDSFVLPNTGNRPGYIFVKEYSSAIGVDWKGKQAKFLKVVIDETGFVITAYPISKLFD